MRVPAAALEYCADTWTSVPARVSTRWKLRMITLFTPCACAITTLSHKHRPAWVSLKRKLA